MIQAVNIVIYELWKLLTVGVTKHLTYRQKACPSSVSVYYSPVLTCLCCHYMSYIDLLWALWHFCSTLKDCFSTISSSWQTFVGGGSVESRGGGLALSLLLSSQIKITVISPEAGLSCHCVKETVIWLVMTQPESHYIFDGRLKQKSISVHLRRAQRERFGKSNLLWVCCDKVHAAHLLLEASSEGDRGSRFHRQSISNYYWC